MYTVDLHTHTRFFHGFESRPTAYDPLGAQLVRLASRWHSLDGVALTNHDYSPGYESGTTETLFVPGIEISTTAGHVLVVGPDPPRRTTPGTLTPTEVVSLAHERGCAAIIAHPFRRSDVRKSGAEFDAVEVNGKHPGNIERVRKLADTLSVPIVGGSDAHYPFEVGRAFTRIEASRLTPETVVEAIQAGRVEPQLRSTAFDEAIQTAYRYIHRYR
ncbi:MULTISPECIES: PHP-associated domain-containing protein [Haloarcula]|uniref:PHP domain protein n=1 Tax=Haloarcula amylolytica JCM 13557 TaxID=1227452 RepID=M0KSV3_9EURY|nr:PHP-associated domain-containing protein [Haloarcula amylolytica]EMA23289.1 PHP domain protein [Haloarcula amylolytica JCM 13557]